MNLCCERLEMLIQYSEFSWDMIHFHLHRTENDLNYRDAYTSQWLHSTVQTLHNVFTSSRGELNKYTTTWAHGWIFGYRFFADMFTLLGQTLWKYVQPCHDFIWCISVITANAHPSIPNACCWLISSHMSTWWKQSRRERNVFNDGRTRR